MNETTETELVAAVVAAADAYITAYDNADADERKAHVRLGEAVAALRQFRNEAS